MYSWAKTKRNKIPGTRHAAVSHGQGSKAGMWHHSLLEMPSPAQEATSSKGFGLQTRRWEQKLRHPWQAEQNLEGLSPLWEQLGHSPYKVKTATIRPASAWAQGWTDTSHVIPKSQTMDRFKGRTHGSKTSGIPGALKEANAKHLFGVTSIIQTKMDSQI